MTKTFAKRFNAQRAAKAALGKDASEGKEFETTKCDNGNWTWRAIVNIENLKPESHPTAAANAESWSAIPSVRKARKKQIGLTPPDFSAKTHERYRGKLAAVVAMVEARDVDGLRSFHINPVSTSPKAIMRYRDKALAELTQ
jgi:hypothetical protein